MQCANLHNHCSTTDFCATCSKNLNSEYKIPDSKKLHFLAYANLCKLGDYSSRYDFLNVRNFPKTDSAKYHRKCYYFPISRVETQVIFEPIGLCLLSGISMARMLANGPNNSRRGVVQFYQGVNN